MFLTTHDRQMLEAHVAALRSGRGLATSDADTNQLVIKALENTLVEAADVEAVVSDIISADNLAVEDAPCPKCGTYALQLRPARRVVECLQCGWSHIMIDSQRDDLVFALAGSSDTPVPEFIRELYALQSRPVLV